MGNEMFTFVVCAHSGHSVSYQYCNRAEADKHFDKLVAGLPRVEGVFVAYYCGSVGGLVNAYHVD